MGLAARTEKHPGGRPAAPLEERRSEVIQVRVTPREADSLCRQALRQGLSLSEFLRARLQALLSAP